MPKKDDRVEAFFDTREESERRVRPERRVSARLNRKVARFAVAMTLLTIALHLIHTMWP